MKKKIIASLLGMVMLVYLSLTKVVAFATATEGDLSGVNADTPAININYSTAAQTDAVEDTTDVDSDIREDIEDAIPDEWEEKKISTVDDFLKFAKDCNLDIWSDNKKIILENDISLVGTDFSGISTFGGYFDGQGHTISELSLNGEMSYAGLFSKLQKNAVVKDLNVTGTIMPSGSPIHVGGICADNSGTIMNCSFKGVVYGGDYVGCIAAVNELSGIITDCQSGGFVNGNHFVGGIAGENMGNTMNCINEALINTTNTDSQMSIDAMSNISAVIKFIKNGEDRSESASSDSKASDVGGICGQSIGIIYRCLNNGDVGYEHVGYNIGGIAGRQSGYILSCTNNGNIHGRKDVGGITGQAEPYITVDLSSDIAYQLSEAISKLHDIITHTLKDAKTQSNTITNRLSIIQQFTAGAIEDVRFLADGTIDYANNISGAANSAFSRIDYVLEESSKNDGLLDQVSYAADDTRKSADELRETIKDLDLEQYMDDGQKEQYDNAKQIIETGTSTYTNLMRMGTRAYRNQFLAKEASTNPNATYPSATDLVYSGDDGSFSNPANYTSTDQDTVIAVYDIDGTWYHNDGNNTAFPDREGDEPRKSQDIQLVEDADDYAATNAKIYANAKYLAQRGDSYTNEMAQAASTVSGIALICAQKMEDATRADALKTISSIEGATDHIYNAGGEAKRIIKNMADADNISFPQLGSDYKAHTSSLANNLQGVNDNFGLLNGEVNNATGVLVDDLQAMADQFNVIMLLYTDAIDGVLEMDYTSKYEDVSLQEAANTMDATIDSCLNYGKVDGDISVSGIAGTMAIDYDFDQEGDITGIKDSKLNSSYITKCVLRADKNYGEVTGEKSNVGGVCGLQEMGTVLNCGNYADASSSSGENVGGVVGSSLSYIVSSFSRGILRGSSYVGGIVGNGMHIRDCFSLVNIEDSTNWYGAVAGHVDEKGEVRNNFFVSDTLAGIDRTSYTKKAEPVSYEKALSENIFITSETEEATDKKSGTDKKTTDEDAAKSDLSTIPDDFKNLTVTYVLENEDLDEGKEIIGKVSRKYGDKLSLDDYPEIKDKDGFYVTWDKPEIENLQTDETITASYTRYLTTITDGDAGLKDEHYQSDILVDGKFKEGDVLTVKRTYYDLFAEDLREKLKSDELSQDLLTIEVEVPEDGEIVHQVRFMPKQDVYDVIGDKYLLYRVVDENRVLLTETGKMGKYRTYEIEGNSFILTMGVKGVNVPIVTIAIYAAIGVIAFIILLIVIIVLMKRHKKKLPSAIQKLKEDVSERIESKEQIFYDDSQEEELQKELKEYKESLKNQKETVTDSEKDSDEDSKKASDSDSETKEEEMKQ